MNSQLYKIDVMSDLDWIEDVFFFFTFAKHCSAELPYTAAASTEVNYLKAFVRSLSLLLHRSSEEQKQLDDNAKRHDSIYFQQHFC